MNFLEKERYEILITLVNNLKYMHFATKYKNLVISKMIEQWMKMIENSK